MRTDATQDGRAARPWATPILLALVLVPIAFNAVALLAELRIAIPSLNDDAVHYLFVQRASEALAGGENLFDHWVPELDLGFPQFFYYQHLPHVAVVILHRLLLKQVSLLTLFNLIRYVLLIGFPVTVYWSMRRLGFSVVASSVSASCSTLIATRLGYGFEYSSYLWSGHGMYTQLWAVHLTFIALALIARVLDRGTGYASAVAACSLLALCHLIYAYITAIMVLVLLLDGIGRRNAAARALRIGAVGFLSAIISAYLWLPWLLLKAYMGVSPYLERWKYDSFGARDILTWLVNGDLLDYGRLPVLTILSAFGVAAALFERTRPARLALTIFFVMLLLFFGRHTWGRAADLLPLGKILHFLRFLGGVHLGAILLIGLGGEWLWRQAAILPERWRAGAAGLVLLALLTPALVERHRSYAQNKAWMERTKAALDADSDARAVLSALKGLPPGRTYAGLRSNWGKGLKFGDIHFYDLLTFHRIVAIMPPYQGHSLNADFIFHFNDRRPADYNLFNVRYVVAPTGTSVAPFLRPITATPRYTLYQADTDGYAQFAPIDETVRVDSQFALFTENRRWFLSAELGPRQFIRYEYPAAGGGRDGRRSAGCGSDDGTVTEERVGPAQLDLKVACPTPSTVVFKTTYHPNWRVSIDGRETHPFMLSPSLIGVDVPAGPHRILAEYRSPIYRNVLLLLGGATLLAAIALRRRFAKLDAILSMAGSPTLKASHAAPADA